MSRMGVVMLRSLHRHCERRRSNPGAARVALDCFVASLLAMTEPSPSLSLPLLHPWIERVAGGVADQIDAQDRQRQHQAWPEDQRWLDLEVGATFRHHVAPGRGFRIDAGA